MRQYKSLMQNLDTADIEESLASVVTRASGNVARVVVEQHGKPVAAIISIEDWQRFARLEAEREKQFAVFDRIEAAFADVPAEEIEAAADRAIAKVRANATVVEFSVEVQGVATPEDDLVLAAALSGEASVLCTRDKQLLKLRAFQGIEILSPGEFLGRIAAE